MECLAYDKLSVIIITVSSKKKKKCVFVRVCVICLHRLALRERRMGRNIRMKIFLVLLLQQLRQEIMRIPPLKWKEKERIQGFFLLWWWIMCDWQRRKRKRGTN